MKLTVLGNNGPFPSAGGACSGYLVSDGEINILIDCGNGVLSNLQKIIPIESLDAIILTHLHNDHISDMMILKYAIQIKKNRGQFGRNIKVYLPPEPAEEYTRLDVKDAFDLIPLQENMEVAFSGIKASFSQMIHPAMDFAVSLEASGKRFVFSGDTSWTEKMIYFAKAADLLMLDCALFATDKTNNNVAHLTAEECGIIAAEAKAKKLLLTHFWPEYDINALITEAKEKFKNVEAASFMNEYVI